DWPGNIRELENALERAVIRSRRHGQLRFDLTSEEPPVSRVAPLPLQGQGESGPKAVLSDAEFRQLERANLRAALEQSGGRIRGAGGAAELLGLKPTTLAARLKALGIRNG